MPLISYNHNPNAFYLGTAYLCYNFNTHKMYHSRHVQFIEDVYPFSQSIPAPTSRSSLEIPISNSQPLTTLHPFLTNSQPTPPISQHPLSNTNTNTPMPTQSYLLVFLQLIRPSPQSRLFPQLIPISRPIPQITQPQTHTSPSLRNPLNHTSTHPMQTRSKSGIHKRKKVNLITKYPLPHSTEPTCVSQALKSPEWQQAMTDEFMALMRNGTWTLVPPQPHYNVIGNKFVFRLKCNPDGSISRYKARLVAKGFHQRPGLDFKDTFSPVIKPQTIKLVLCLALSNGWPLTQMDVNNAFLHGTIDEDVYMAQPAGFIHSSFPNYVCKLQKALYGLKQAPRAWFHALRDFLLQSGFNNAKSDTSLFTYKSSTSVAYFLIYADDLLLTSNDPGFLCEFKSSLAAKFSLKDLGQPSHFLGVEILPTSSGLFLTQHHYIRDLLQRANMADSKPVSTPMATTFCSMAVPDSSTCDSSLFRSLIGSLRYLSITRPDVAFSVNKLAQHMQSPTATHM